MSKGQTATIYFKSGHHINISAKEIKIKTIGFPTERLESVEISPPDKYPFIDVKSIEAIVRGRR